MSNKEIQEYHDKYDDIPKDWLERLSYLYRLKPYSREILNELIEEIDSLKETEWDEITYIFYMDPRSTPRPKLNRKTFTFYVKNAKNHKQIFDEFIEFHSELNIVISTPTILTTKVYTETPKSMTMKEMMAAELELIHNVNSPDWDNIGKTYCDMIQDTLISNDSIVIKGSVEKIYSILQRIEVNVKFMKKYDCKYNKSSVERRKSFKENPLTVEGLDCIIGGKRKNDKK